MSTLTRTLPAIDNYTLIRSLRFGYPSLSACAIFLLALLPMLGMAILLDERTVLDINIWVKPIKFSISLAIYTLTLSCYSIFLPSQWRNSRWFNYYVALVIFTIIGEMIWLIYAASIGEPSHFNQTHPVLAPVYPLMGVFATVLTSLSLIIGIGIIRNKASSLSPTLKYSLAYSLIATFILTMFIAGHMAGGPAQSHTVLPAGVTSVNESHAIPILGWLLAAGDLRVAHFFATHALHGIPLIAWLLNTVLSRHLPTSAKGGRAVGITLTLAYSILVIGLFIQAKAGLPFLPLNA